MHEWLQLRSFRFALFPSLIAQFFVVAVGCPAYALAISNADVIMLFSA